MKADSWIRWIGLDWKFGGGLRNNPGSFYPFKDAVTEAQRRRESFQDHTAFGMEPGPEVSSLYGQHPRGGLRGALPPAGISGFSPVSKCITHLLAAGFLLLASPSSASSDGSSQVETVPFGAAVPVSEPSPSLFPARAGLDTPWRNYPSDWTVVKMGLS